MTRKDAEFAKIYTEDSSILPVVGEILSSPFQAPDFAREIFGILESSEDPTAFLKYCPDIMNLNKELLFNPEIVDKPDSNLDSLYQMEDLPEQLKIALIKLLSSVDNAYSMIDECYKNLDEQDRLFINRKVDDFFNPHIELEADEEDIAREIDELLYLSKRIDLFNIISTSCIIIDALVDFENMILNNSDLKDLILDRRIISRDKGKFLLSGSNNDDHNDYFSLIIDFGGDDNYEFCESGSRKDILVILDLSGNDYYYNESPNADVCIIIDSKGDDIYDGKGFCLGSGVFGVGVLWDKDGNDIYISDYASQGFAAGGLGMLLDDNGNDYYLASTLSQGASVLAGLGVIHDRRGDDTYRAGDRYPDEIRNSEYYLSMSQGFAMGLRPFVSGGLGIMLDGYGSDKYFGGVFGQGAGYWHSAGLLWDNSGDDYYSSRQYSQGCGIHSGAGMLIDIAGNDRYDSHSQAQGCGYDHSVGILIEKSGDDSYLGDWHVQGAGAHNSFALFLDSSGKDKYVCNEVGVSRGFADMYRDHGGIGLFIDIGGIDLFIPEKPSTEKYWSVNQYSCGYDGE